MGHLPVVFFYLHSNTERLLEGEGGYRTPDYDKDSIIQFNFYFIWLIAVFYKQSEDDLPLTSNVNVSVIIQSSVQCNVELWGKLKKTSYTNYYSRVTSFELIEDYDKWKYIWTYVWINIFLFFFHSWEIRWKIRNSMLCIFCEIWSLSSCIGQRGKITTCKIPRQNRTRPMGTRRLGGEKLSFSFSLVDFFFNACQYL